MTAVRTVGVDLEREIYVRGSVDLDVTGQQGSFRDLILLGACDADDFIALAVQRNAPADCLRIAAEAALPQRMREHHRPGRARDVIRGREGAAKDGLRAAQ